MKQGTLSMQVFAIYMAILCVVFIVFPNNFAALFKLGPPDGLWIRIRGMVLGIIDSSQALGRRQLVTFIPPAGIV